MQPKNQGFATTLIILCVVALSLASGVYLYNINTTTPQDVVVENIITDNVATDTVVALVSTSSLIVEHKDTSVLAIQKVTTKTLETKTTRVVLGSGGTAPAYTLTLASKAQLSWQFGRDYVDITVQIDNHCQGKSCPTPPINFIARDLKNTRAHEWLVGDWMIAASGYAHGIMPAQSYVITVRDSVTKETLGNANISIDAGEYSSSYVTVLTPNVYGEKLSRGSHYALRWTTWPLKHIETMRISVKNPVDCPPSAPSEGAQTTQPAPFPHDGCVGTGKTYVIANDVPNTGTYTWRAGTDAGGKSIPSGNYIVIIEAPGQAYAESHAQFVLE